MEDASELERLEAERTMLLDDAARIVRSAEAGDQAPNAAEDELVLKLMTRVRKLEAEIEHLKRHQQHT
jgi:hypothetical protein